MNYSGLEPYEVQEEKFWLAERVDIVVCNRVQYKRVHTGVSGVLHTTENPCNFLPLAFPARQLTLESELWLFGGHDMSR